MTRLPRSTASRVALAGLALVGGFGCNQTASFRLRWQIEARDGELLPVTDPLQCSEFGMNTMRVLVTDPAGLVAFDDVLPCFAHGFANPERMFEGPELDAGHYIVEVRGLQRDLQPWEDAPLDPTSTQFCSGAAATIACNEVDVACDCQQFDAEKDVTVTLDPFVLTAPRECIDGIDNDRDGLVDDEDAACGIDGLASESLEVSAVQFRAVLSLFDGNPRMTCEGVRLIDLRARVCRLDELGDDGACDDTSAVTLDPVPCRLGEPSFFATTLGEGEWVLELTGRGPGGTLTTVPATFPFTLQPGPGAFVPIAVDFPAEAFEPAIEAAAAFALEFARGDAESTATRTCLPPVDGGALAIADLVLELRDAHGGPLPSPASLSDGTVLDGTPIPCPSAIVRTAALSWGGFSLRAQARAADGTVCFSTDTAEGGGAPLMLAPGSSAISLVIPRVLDENGLPPTACRDCTTDVQCVDGTCVGGLCE